MKTIFLIFVGLLSLITTCCVQKSYKRTVNFIVDVSEVKNIKSVGIRGEKPLDWNYDTEMKVIKKDSLYKATITFETGYKFVEMKFTVNGDYELKDQPNRKVIFFNDGETNYKAVFNVMK
ncbi:hypothetical protein [Flavobacterium sp.]|uniref:hypothetical protein n=1 Tax=Flavobacterium sp. TaxID=239 RepID=UPI00286B4DBC|nr:hypothetical protein [Flavobacterium sp.]